MSRTGGLCSGDYAGSGRVVGKDGVDPGNQLRRTVGADRAAEVQRLVELKAWQIREALPGIGGRPGARRRCGAPGWAAREGLAPGGQAAFAGVDFLAAAEQADDGGPALRTGHDVEQAARLGVGQRDGAVLRLAGGVGPGPAALRLVDDEQAVGGRPGVPDVVVAEGVQRLDHGFDALPCRAGGEAPAGRVPHQGGPKHVEQGRVAGEEGGAGVRGEGKVQAAERLTGAGVAGHEHDGAFVGGARPAERGEDGGAGAAEIAAAGVGEQQSGVVVVGVEPGGGGHEGGDGAIGGVLPACRIKPRQGRALGHPVEQATELKAGAGDGRRRAWEQQRALGHGLNALHQSDRQHRDVPAAAMEIGQIDRGSLGAGTVRGERQHGGMGDEHGLDATAQPGEAQAGDQPPVPGRRDGLHGVAQEVLHRATTAWKG